MPPKIVLVGATGYTGGRTAEAMATRGLRPVLAGRDPARLGRVADRLGGLPTARADVTDVGSVRALVEPGDVLVSSVGPFARLGRAALEAAIGAGAVYLDSTGEPPFIREVFARHAAAAERSGAALLTAFGHDYVPGVLAGALALREAGAGAARVDVGYFLTGGGPGQAFSRGTLDSLIGVATSPGYAVRDGRLRTEPAAARLRTFDVAGRPRPAVTVGGTEHFALPRLAPGLRTVDVYLGWFGPASGVVHAAHRLPPLLAAVPALDRRLTALAGLGTRWLAEAPSPSALATVTSHVVAEVFDGRGELLARTRLRGPEPYAITADLLAWGAGRAAAHGVHGVGALDPVGAFGLDELASGAADAGLSRS